MSCKAFFSGKSPYITLRLGKCLIKVRIYYLLSLNSAFFLQLCDFPQLGHFTQFTVVGLVPWPLREREVEVDLVLIQTSFLL